MEPTRRLAAFISELNYENIPSPVVRKAKLCLLDYLANVYGSLELAAVEAAMNYIKSLGASGPATVLGCGFKTDIHHAALANGVLAEAIESQDGLRFGGNHPGAAVIPAALAAAEQIGVGGRRVIEALVAGYEAANRPAMAMHPWHTLKGFLPTGTCGAFGAAAAAAKVRGADAGRTLNALGNAGYLLPISMAEQLMGGFTIKIMQGGQAALAGLLAAGLAEAGITGTPYVLEGSPLKGGFTQITTAADPKMERLTEALGEKFTIMDVYFKPYTACRHTHGGAQAVLALKRENNLDPNEVEKVEVFTYGLAELAVGKNVVRGDTFVSAQFSLPYVIAVCLMDGELGPGQLTEKRLADASLLELSARVKVKTDEELNQAYPDKTATRVEIVLKNGERLSRQVDIPYGDPRDPLETDALAHKVKRFAGSREADQVEKLIELILDLEKVEDIGRITNLV
ncbi:MAG: MmgE/PrpD family protein [Thermodesulfobacteriota bacterium]